MLNMMNFGFDFKSQGATKLVQDLDKINNSLTRLSSIKLDKDLSKDIYYLSDAFNKFALTIKGSGLNRKIEYIGKIITHLNEQFQFKSKSIKNLQDFSKAIEKLSQNEFPKTHAPRITAFADSLMRLSGVRVKDTSIQIKNAVNSLNELTRLKIPSNLHRKFQSAIHLLEKFRYMHLLRMPDIDGIIKALKKLIKLKVSKKRAKSLETIGLYIHNIVKIANIKVPDMSNIKKLKKAVKTLAKIRVSKKHIGNIKSIIRFMNSITKFTQAKIDPKGIRKIAKAVQKLAKIKIKKHSLDQLKKLIEYFEKIEKIGPGVSRSLDQVNRSTARSGRGGFMPDFTRMRKKSSGFFTYFRGQIGGLTMLMGGVGGALIAGLQGSMEAYREFDKAAREAMTLLNEHKAELLGGLDGVKASIQNVASEYGQELVQTANAFTKALGAGVSAAALEDTVGLAAKLASASGTTTEKAAEGIITLANTYGVAYTDVEAMKKISDTLFATFNFGVTSVEALSKNVFKLAPTAKMAGLSMEEMMGSVAGLTSEGRSTRMAFMEANAMLMSFIKPASTYKKKMEEIGISTGMTAFEVQGGLIPSLLNAEKAMRMKGLSPEQIFQQKNAMRAFGTFSAGFRQLGLDSDKFAKKLESDKAFNVWMKNIGTQMGVGEDEIDQFARRGLGQVYNALKDVGKGNEETLNNLVQDWGVSEEKIRSMWSGTTAEMAESVEDVGTAAASMIKQMYHPIMGMGSEIGTVTNDAFEKMRTGFDFQLNQFKTNVKILGVNTIESLKPVLSAFLSLGNAFVSIKKTIGDSFKFIFGEVKDQYGKVIDETDSFTDKVIGKANRFQDRLASVFKPIKVDYWGAMSNSVEQSAVEFRDFLKIPEEERMQFHRGLADQGEEIGNWERAFAVYKAETKDGIDYTRNFVANMRDAVELYKLQQHYMKTGDVAALRTIQPQINEAPLFNFITKVKTKIRDIKTLVVDFWKGFTESPEAKRAWEGIKGFFKLIFGGFQRIVEVISGAFAGLAGNTGAVEAGISQGKAFGAGVAGGIAGLYDIIKPIIQIFETIVFGITKLINSVFIKLRPLVIQIGSVVKSIAEGIKSTILKVLAFSFSIISKIVEIIVPVIQKIIATFEKLIPIITGIIGTLIDTLWPILEDIFNFLKEIFTVVGNLIYELVPVIFGLIQTIGSFAASIFNTIKPILSGIMKFVSGIIKVVVPIVSGVISVIIEMVKIVITIITETVNFFAELASEIFGDLGGKGMSTMDMIGKIGEGIKWVFLKIVQGLKVATTVVKVIFAFIKGAIKPLMDAASFFNIMPGKDPREGAKEAGSLAGAVSGTEPLKILTDTIIDLDKRRKVRGEGTSDVQGDFLSGLENFMSDLENIGGPAGPKLGPDGLPIGDRGMTEGAFNMGKLLGVPGSVEETTESGIFGGLSKFFGSPEAFTRTNVLGTERLAEVLATAAVETPDVKLDESSITQLTEKKEVEDEKEKKSVDETIERATRERVRRERQAPQAKQQFNLNLSIKDEECGERRTRIQRSKIVDKQFQNWYCEVDAMDQGTS